MAVDPKLAAHTFGELLHDRAAAAPDETAFTFLRDGEGDEDAITLGELHARALAVAGLLRTRLAAGARALLLFPPGLDYVVSVFACFYAGVVGVCAAPPHPKRLHRTLPRLLAIAADADVEAVLAPAAVGEGARQLLAADHPLARAVWLAPDASDVSGDDFEPALGRPDDVGLLQYTSGSTADPRGVMLTHANLLDNSEFIATAFGHTPESRGFIWLPPYHDMGLIGGILQPVYAGFPCVLTSPVHVIKRPARWLEGVSRHRATTSGGADFPHQPCVRPAEPAPRAPP